MSNWKYDPDDARRCFPEGEYPATVVDCEYGQSRAGNDMATIKVVVYGDGDKKIKITDWVVNHIDMLWKLKHLAKAVGKEDDFAAGEFEPHHAVNESVTVKLSEEDDPKYGEQNRIVDYKECGPIAPKPKRESRPPSGETTIPDDDDIPF